ncbi:hypothetical protein [Pseudomonas sp. P8_250]|uniref:hypothetical protein n=1 Tax=Pseudomonas sp. P8_250 TaxID=3043446 RepID=UPI002A36607F|nr:hypothetical protein [Pseudomonas sp. P8_250]MDX9668717.1 hypothetical protein [Pseudomonas sp. P8_250]
MKTFKHGLLAAMSLVMVVGCAARPPLYALKDGTTAEERTQDGATCQAQLVQPEPLRSGNWSKRSFTETRGIEQELRKDYINCMTSKGYRIVTG